MIRVSWQIETDYMGADEHSCREVLYLTPEQYKEFREDLKKENAFKGLLISGRKNSLSEWMEPGVIHPKNKKYTIIDGDGMDNLAFEKWTKDGFKKRSKTNRNVEVTSHYNIYNSWDVKYEIDEHDTTGLIEHEVEEDK